MRGSVAEAGSGSLAGQLLVAMPQMQDERFVRSVIFMCAHNAEGAMGLVINKFVGSLTTGELYDQLDIQPTIPQRGRPVFFGGPVESGRGFVLHTADYREEATMVVGGNIALTATLEILRAMGRGEGPRETLLALGYAGWGPGQLDAEIQMNGWLSVAADEGIVFGAELEDKWRRALAKLGIDVSMLSTDSGHA